MRRLSIRSTFAFLAVAVPLLAFGSTPAFADGPVEAELERMLALAESRVADKMWPHAEPALRDALRFARAVRAPAAEARAFERLAFIHDVRGWSAAKPELVPGLLDRAAAAAARAGDGALEQRLLVRLAASAERRGLDELADRADRAALDVACARRDLSFLNILDRGEAWPKVAVAMLDFLAEAELADTMSEERRAGIGRFVQAAARADLGRSEAAGRERLAAHLVGVAARLGDRDLAVGLLVEADEHLRLALARHARRGDDAAAGRVRLALARVASLSLRDADARSLASLAVADARRARRPAIESDAASFLASVAASASTRARLQAAAARLDRAQLDALERRAHAALAHPKADVAPLVAELRAFAGRCAGADRARVDALVEALAGGPPAVCDPTPEETAALDATLRAAIAKGWPESFVALAIVERAGRTDAWPAIAETLPTEGNAFHHLHGLESLATRRHLPRLLELAVSDVPDIADAAAAAVFRVATSDDVDAVAGARRQAPLHVAGIWLDAALARHAPAPERAAAVGRLHETHLEADASGLRVAAAAALGALGFASPLATIDRAIGGPDETYAMRVLARTPRGFGDDLLAMTSRGAANRWARAMAARARTLRGDPRVGALARTERDAVPLAFAVPIRGRGRLFGAAPAARRARLEGELTPIFAFAAAELGSPVGDAVLDALPREGAAAVAATVREASRAAAARRSRRVGPPGICVLPVVADEGEAVFVFLAAARTGAVDASGSAGRVVRVPVTVGHVVEARGAGLAGQLFAQELVDLALLGDGIIQDAVRVHLDGREASPIAASLSVPSAYAMEGAREATLSFVVPDDVEVGDVLRGRCVVPLDFFGVPGSVAFPVVAFGDGPTERPDIEALDVTVSPPLPAPGEVAVVSVSAVAHGRRIDSGASLLARFELDSPQRDAVAPLGEVRFSAAGWAPGEERSFSVAPSFSGDLFLNDYLPFPRGRGTSITIRATLDAEDALEEVSEDDNVAERELSLFVEDDALARRLARSELQRRVDRALAGLEDAATPEEALAAVDEALAAIDGSGLDDPDLDAARRLLDAASGGVRAEVRARAALELVREGLATSPPDRAMLLAAADELAAAQLALLDSGTPVSLDTLTAVRNTAALASGLTGGADELLQSAPELIGAGAADAVSAAGELAARTDAVLQLGRFARDLKRGADPRDALEAAASLLGPAFPTPNVAIEAFSQIVEHARGGFERATGVLDLVNREIGGERIDEAELVAALDGLERHFDRPINGRRILTAAGKDLGVAGSVFDGVSTFLGL